MKILIILLALFHVAVFAQKSVKIGEQVWMAQNLDSKAKKKGKHGGLYDWESANKACPKGWHLPSDNDWQTLVNFTGDTEFAGRDLKSKTGWDKKSNGTDKYKFAALPGRSAGESTAFGKEGCDGGCWWSSTEANEVEGNAYARQISYDRSDDESEGYSVERFYDAKEAMFSVRCIKEKTE